MKVLVTGATGFLGSRTVEKLLAQNFSVMATGRNKIKLAKLKDLGADTVQGSLEDLDFTEKISEKIDIIVHSAALSSPWGRYHDFYQANIEATKNLLLASKKNQVRRFVHVSTPSIYFDYQDRFAITEDFLPEKFVNHYAATKYEAEKLVSQAAKEGLETISLRPRAIVGAGDTTIMPRLLKANQEGKLKIIGDGKNIVDVTSVANVVDAIILGINAPNEALGHNYNITNGEPVKLWELIEETLAKMNLSLNKKKVPFFVAYNLAKGLEAIAKLRADYQEPVLTCYGVGILAKSMTMNIDKAKDLLGYQPLQSNYQAVDEFVEWWKNKKD